MKNDFTVLCWVIDESSSMFSRRMDVIGGFNKFIEDQKQLPGQCAVTLVKFNTNSRVIYNLLDINHVKALEPKTYSPSGCTALIDALCDAIDNIGKVLAELPEEQRPARVVIISQTDGEENSSQRFDVQQLRDKIEHQKTKYNWQFLFLGCDIDAFGAGSNIGIDLNKTANFSNTSKGYSAMYKNTSSLVSSLRTCNVQDMSAVGYSAENRAEMEEDDSLSPIVTHVTK